MSQWRVQPKDFDRAFMSKDPDEIVQVLSQLGRVLCDIRHILEVLIPQNDTLPQYDEEAESFIHNGPVDVDDPAYVAPGVDKNK